MSASQPINIGIDCTFKPNGKVRVRRIQLDEVWLPVAQGRQWVDNAGRHLLIMLPDETVEEILLQSYDLSWQLVQHRFSTGHLKKSQS